MLVDLSSNSWHSKFYTWVTDAKPNKKFKSICPYFWTIVFYLLSSPVILLFKGFIRGLVVIIHYSEKRAALKSESKKTEKTEKKQSKLSKWLSNINFNKLYKWAGRIYLGVMISFLLLLFGYLIYTAVIEKGWIHTLILLSFALAALIVLTGLIYGFIKFFESDTWNMVKGMGFSFKHKVCPMIKWDADAAEKDVDIVKPDTMSAKKKRGKKDEI